MADGKEILSEELRQRVEELARAQKREPSEVLGEAVNQYAASCRLERFAAKMGKRTRERDIREEDIPRLVDEVRRENESRGR